MGVAALVLGIISIIVGFVPFCGAIAFVPAIIGLVLGIVDTVKKSKSGEKKGMSIAGIVLCAIAILIIAYWVFVVAASASYIAGNSNEILDALNEAMQNMTVVE